MAKEYIEREALLKNLNRFAQDNYCVTINDVIMNLPAADVAEVVHGRWMLEREPDGKTYCFHCSACDSGFSHISIYNVGDWNYCPNCGAKMDGGE